MKNLFLALLATAALAACSKGSSPSPAPSPTPAPSCSNGATNPPACNNNVPAPCTNGATNPPACNNNVPPPPAEPASHKQPAGLDASGRKLGSCVQTDPGALTWTRENTTFSPAPNSACVGNEVLGQACSGGGCKAADGSYMICEQSKSPVWDCWAWVYEEDAVAGGTTSKPLAGVTAYVVDFPYDMTPASSKAVSDQWGYVEVTGGIYNELSFYAPAGYYMGACTIQHTPWNQEAVITMGWTSGKPFPAVPLFKPVPANACGTSAQAVQLKMNKPHAEVK